jgi:predicted outer membrane protein
LAGGPVGAVVGAGVGAATTGSGSGMPTLFPGGGLDSRRAAMLNQLAAASGREFDQLYRQMQVMAHQEAIALFTAYAQQPDDPALGAFARQTLPHLRAHYASARRL